ncbi:family 2 glycosyl transferase [Enterobacter asburiae]|uniref:Family 2 glycosyl transferase n=1 Tax=Enterobacter asburiae TaxID=61645 RepID=A0A376F3V1_ENTAS|nr:family 2 glycosyl transferase [Enterobacter asburiae]
MKISLVVPVFNEEEAIPIFYKPFGSLMHSSSMK